ncbi:MAG TPA: bifunctional metallophosphatase/5'-nucleotidase, partial [Bacillota bacterium]|nr:bifunctional metallophosphatase/5'-nucleotidase [Bacillota bacterium]
DEGCDVIVVYAHEGSYIDTSIANLTGNHYVNAIFNAHTHQNEHGTISRSTGVAMPYAQASNSEYSLFSRITLTYDREAGEVTASSSSIKSLMDVSYNSDSSIADILYQYDNDVDYRAFVDQVLAHTDTSYSSSALAKWGASVIRDYTGVDVGALNRGGFRVTMPAGDVTMADLITVYPFDNYIKTCEMTGAELTDLYESLSSTDVVFDDSLSYSSGTLYINGIPVQNNGTYTIGAVDYIFDKDYYPFMYGDNIQTTTYLMRDLLAEDLGNTTGTFNPYDGTSASLSTFIFEPVIVLRSDFGLIN